MFKGACRLDDPAHRTIIFFNSSKSRNFIATSSSTDVRHFPKNSRSNQAMPSVGSTTGNCIIERSTPDRT